MTNKLTEERQRIRRILDVLDLPTDQYFLNGSGAMACYGVHRERPMGDLDIFVTTDLWFKCYNEWNLATALSHYGREGVWTLIVPNAHDDKRRCDPPILRGKIDNLTIDIFSAWRHRSGPAAGNIDVGLYMFGARMPWANIPCAPLELILEWKLGVNRAKDLLDVIAIREAMGWPDPSED